MVALQAMRITFVQNTASMILVTGTPEMGPLIFGKLPNLAKPMNSMAPTKYILQFWTPILL